MNTESTIDPIELRKFAQLAEQWWHVDGELKTLHDINPLRMQFITDTVPVAAKKILDVGCGGGILTEALAKSGAKVTGIDAEQSVINAAKLHALNTNLSVDYQCGPLETFESAPFEVITCMEMLEHVASPETVINHCARLLLPHGYLFLSTINRTVKAYATTIFAAEYLFNLLPRQTHDYQKFIKPSELAAMARGANLDVIGLKGIAYNPITRQASFTKTVAANYVLVCRKLSSLEMQSGGS